MNKAPVLVGFAVPLFFSGCQRPPAGAVERRFALPDGMGTFSIRLDSSFARIDSGVHYGCTGCESRLSQVYTIRGWPDSIHSPLTGLDVSRDSLFRFTWSVNLRSPAECDSGPSVQQWLRAELRSLRLECPTCAPADSGIVELNGTQWAFIRCSDDRAAQNDMLHGYARVRGRGMSILWQRISPTAAAFDFGAYARRQFATVRFDGRRATAP